MKPTELQQAFLDCRVLRHRWDRIQDDGGLGRQYKESRTVVRVAKRCERCTTLRLEAWSAVTGALIFVEYRYPEGYQFQGGDYRPSHFRKEFASREKKLAKAPALRRVV